MDLLYKEQALLMELTKKKQIFTQNMLDAIMKQFQGAK